jgi:hypothetical protein
MLMSSAIQPPPGEAVDACSSTAAGQTIEVDIIIDGLPEVAGSTMGIIAFDLALAYDPSVVKVTAIDVDQLLGVKPNSFVTSLGDAMPDADGSLHVSAADFGPTDGDISTISETTGGVLVRVAFEAVGDGVSALALGDAALIDTRNDAHPVSEGAAARIAVGSACG